MRRLQRAQAGVSLIELMVALTIDSLLIVGTITVYSNSRSTFAVTENGLYSLAVELTADGFRLTATPRAEGGQRDDAKCATLGIDQSGRRSGLGADGTDTTRDCWR